MTTIGGKQFINRGTSENPIYQRVGSSASIVSGGTAIDGANVSTGTDAPESPADGDLWFNETVGSLFVYIDSTGWVESNPGGGGGVGTVGYGGSSVNAKTEEFFYSDAAYTTPVLLSNDTDGSRFYHKDGYIIVNLVYESSSSQSSNVDVTYYPPDSATGFIVGATKKSGSSGHGYDQNMTFAMAPGSSCQIGNTNFTCRAATVTLLDAGGGGGGGVSGYSVADVFTMDFGDTTGGSWFRTVLDDFNEATDKIYFLDWLGGSWQVSGAGTKGRRTSLEIPVTASESTYGLVLPVAHYSINISLQSNGSLYVYSGNSGVEGTSLVFMKVRSSSGGGGGGAEWVALNQTLTNHLVGSSSNISSTTDLGTGKTKITFENAYSSAASYGVGALAYEASSSSVYLMIVNAAADSFEIHNRVADSYRDAADLRAVISG